MRATTKEDQIDFMVHLAENGYSLRDIARLYKYEPQKSYVSEWMVSAYWYPRKRSEQVVINQIMGECIERGYGVRQIQSYFKLKSPYYIYRNVEVKKLYRRGKAKRALNYTGENV